MASYAESVTTLTQGSIIPSSPSISDSVETAVDSLAQSPSTICHECSQTFGYGNHQDLGNNLDQPCHGWPELTKVIVQNPGFESFQVFRDLHIKSLLYYQAELVDLRKELHKLEWKDHCTGNFPRSNELCANVAFLISSEDGASKKGQRQMRLVRKIRGVLKEYNEALLQYSRINDLPAAEDFNVNGVRTWLRDPKLGNFNATGPGQDSWGDPHKNEGDPQMKLFKGHLIRLLRSMTIFWAEKPKKWHPDLIVPRTKKDIDGFTRWVANDWIPFWHSLNSIFKHTDSPRSKAQELPTNGSGEKRRSSFSSTASIIVRWVSETIGWTSRLEPDSRDISSQRPTLTTYHMSRMRRFTSFVTTIVACLLPTAAIAVLSTIHSQAELIGIIALFTAIFAMGLMGLTDSGTSRTEIFTATAAFSAVLVVFVQNQQSPYNGVPAGG